MIFVTIWAWFECLAGYIVPGRHVCVTVCVSAGTDDEAQEYEYLGAWGPRFDKLADMYGPRDADEQL